LVPTHAQENFKNHIAEKSKKTPHTSVIPAGGVLVGGSRNLKIPIAHRDFSLPSILPQPDDALKNITQKRIVLLA